MRVPPPKTRLGLFIDALKQGRPNSQDPFDPNYFSMEEHVARKDAEEPLLVEMLIKRAERKVEQEKTRRLRAILNGNPIE